MYCRSVLTLALMLCWLPLASSADKETPEGFLRLFNGKDLNGWQVFGGNKDAWGTEDGLLYVKGGGGGWLMTDKEYGDFELMLEFRMPKMGNSGVALRAPLKGDPAYEGMEIQLLDDDNWKGLRPTQYCGSIYDVVPASKHVTRPHGEWNKMHIVARGPKVAIELNDTMIVDANLNEHKEQAKKHPGLLRDKGHIGFQSYNYRVDFRNIVLKPL